MGNVPAAVEVPAAAPPRHRQLIFRVFQMERWQKANQWDLFETVSEAEGQ